MGITVELLKMNPRNAIFSAFSAKYLRNDGFTVLYACSQPQERCVRLSRDTNSGDREVTRSNPCRFTENVPLGSVVKHDESVEKTEIAKLSWF